MDKKSQHTSMANMCGKRENSVIIEAGVHVKRRDQVIKQNGSNGKSAKNIQVSAMSHVGRITRASRLVEAHRSLGEHLLVRFWPSYDAG